MTHYNAALVGLGNIAWKLGSDDNNGASLSHASAYMANKNTQLSGGFSPDLEDVILICQRCWRIYIQI